MQTQYAASRIKQELMPAPGALIVLVLVLGLMFFRVLGEIVTVLAGLAFLVHCARTRAWAWVRSPFFIVCLALWAWVSLVVSPLAMNVEDSFMRALPWLRYPLLALALSHWLLKKRQALMQSAALVAGLATCIVLDTLVQYFIGTSLTGIPKPEIRLTGPMGAGNVKVGIFLAKICFPVFGIWLLATWGQQTRKMLFTVLTLMSLIMLTIFLSGERTAFLSTCIGFASVGLLLILHRPRIVIPLATAACVAVALSAVANYTQVSVNHRIMMSMEHLEQFRQSPYGQILVVAWNIGWEHWVHGSGLKSFNGACQPLLAAKLVTECNMHAHNPYLEFFTEAGVVGLLLFIAMVATLVRWVGRDWYAVKWPNAIVQAFALGTLVINLFPVMVTQSFFSNWPALLLWLSLSLGISSLNLVRQDVKP